MKKLSRSEMKNLFGGSADLGGVCGNDREAQAISSGGSVTSWTWGACAPNTNNYCTTYCVTSTGSTYYPSQP